MPTASPKKNLANAALRAATFFVAGLFFIAPAHGQQSQTPTKSAQTTPATNTAKPSAPSTPKKSSSSPAGATHSTLTTDKQKDSYALGMNVGRGLVQQPIDIDVTTFMQGIRDALP